MREYPTRVCVVCNSPFTVRPGKIEAARIYCSHKCANQRPSNIPTHTCRQCGKEFQRRIKKHDPCLCCSVQCNADYRRKGYVKRGYKLVRVGGPQVPEHRLIAEGLIGRPLRSDEHVHHINRDTLDNRPENLQVLSVSEHMSLHSKERGVGFGKDNPNYRHGRYCRKRDDDAA